MNRARLKGVTKSAPCEICQGNHKCSRGEDGFILCGRPPDLPPSGFIFLGRARGDEQFGQYRRSDDPIIIERDRQWKEDQARNPSQVNPFRPRVVGTTNPPPNGHSNGRIDIAEQAANLARATTDADRADLAAELCLPVSSISSLPVGFSAKGFHRDYEDKPCWTFPETDAKGRVVGDTCRYADGKKKAMPGGSRGLFLPAGWQERAGPVCIPEGASDTLTLSALGLAAVGRPSCTGGVEHLAELLGVLPAKNAPSSSSASSTPTLTPGNGRAATEPQRRQQSSRIVWDGRSPGFSPLTVPRMFAIG